MDSRLVEPFVKSAKEIIKQMTDIDLEVYGEPISEEGDIASYGVASIINFSGKIKGRFVLDISPKVASKMVENMMGEPQNIIRDRMFLAAISEMNNIIAGDANTNLNNEFSLGLRLAPPIVFVGNNLVVATSKMNSSTVTCKTLFGDLKLNIGFQGGIE